MREGKRNRDLMSRFRDSMKVSEGATSLIDSPLLGFYLLDSMLEFRSYQFCVLCLKLV